VRFEPTTILFERAKTVHALDRVATVIGKLLYILTSIRPPSKKEVTNGLCFMHSYGLAISRQRECKETGEIEGLYIAISQHDVSGSVTHTKD
jgi:hypothetical protein